jgi:predicted NUDIX family phosphoesterase
MNDNEMIFCLSRQGLEAFLGAPLPQGGFTGPGLGPVLSLPQHFIRRKEAEHAPGYKQLIPYQLFASGDCFFVYRRGGGVGEGRLAGRLSVGIGGHINNDDAEKNLLDLQTYEAALQRERTEELLCPDDMPTDFIGWINDDSDPVGQVHLGAVHLCQVRDRNSLQVREQGEDIHAQGWWDFDEVKKHQESFEKWSLLAVELAHRHL